MPNAHLEPLEARRLLAGEPDPFFADAGLVQVDLVPEANEVADAVAVDADGRAYVVTEPAVPNGVPRPDHVLSRFTPDGALDADWGDGGTVRLDLTPGPDRIAALDLDAQGRPVVAGDNADGTFLLRLDAAGDVDAGFGGVAYLADGIGGISHLAIDGDGRLVTYGAARGATIADRDLGVRRWLAGPDGPTLDSAFNGGQGFSLPASVNHPRHLDGVSAMAVDSRGRTLLAGRTSSSREVRVVRLGADGRFDAGFGFGGGARTITADADAQQLDPPAMTVDAQDRPVLAYAEILRAGTVMDRLNVRRLTDAGGTDFAFAGDGRAEVPTALFESHRARAVLAQPDGSVVVVAKDSPANVNPTVTHPGGILAARFLPDGTPDPTYGIDGVAQTDLGADDASPWAAALTPDGDALVVGSIGGGGTYGTLLARLAGSPRPPYLAAGRFEFAGYTQSIFLDFSVPLAEPLGPADLTLTNRTTGEVLPGARFDRYRADLDRDHWFIYRTRDFGPLPDGRYRLTVDAGAAVSRDGLAADGDVAFEFAFLNGDFDGNGRVDLADFTALAGNFGRTSGAFFSRGDANYDGRVNLADFTILAGNFGASLPDDDGGGSLFD